MPLQRSGESKSREDELFQWLTRVPKFVRKYFKMLSRTEHPFRSDNNQLSGPLIQKGENG